MQIFNSKTRLNCICVGLVSLFANTSSWASGNAYISEAGGGGPFPAIAQTQNAMPLNTLYRPKELASAKLPLVLWGNGACHDDGLAYSAFLQEIASHGFIIISAGTPKKASAKEPETSTEITSQHATPAEPVGFKADATTSQQLLDGIEWVMQENKDSDSVLYQKIDVQHIAVMGHSCGGLQALQIATDPRISTAIIMNSGVIDPPLDVQSEALKLPKSILEKLHSPIAYINGGPSDIAYKNGLDDFKRIDHVPVFFAENGVGHGGTYEFPNGGAYAQVAIHWLSWQLKGDAQAASWFVGQDCLLCKDVDWKVQQKNLN